MAMLSVYVVIVDDISFEVRGYYSPGSFQVPASYEAVEIYMESTPHNICWKLSDYTRREIEDAVIQQIINQLKLEAE